LRILQLLKTIPLHLSYFLHAVDLHSLQAPYVYEFFSSLSQLFHSMALEEDIEAVRNDLKQSKLKIRGNDMGAGSLLAGSNGERTVASIARLGISSTDDCRFLAALVKQTKAKAIIELGTSLGIATGYISKAARQAVVYSMEGNEQLCDLAEHHWAQLGNPNIELIRGNIDQNLPAVLSKLKTIDFAVIDANHTGGALLNYFQQINEHLSEEGVIYIDDIKWSCEMYNAWREIVNRDHITLSMELRSSGLVINKAGINKQHYILSL